MFNFTYAKQYSLKNKNAEVNQKVIDHLIQLSSKSEKENSMRITVFNRGTFHFPYTLSVSRKEVNENNALIEAIIRVKMTKLILLSLFSSVFIFGLLILVFGPFWLLLIALLHAVIIYQIGRKKVVLFTEKMVHGWFVYMESGKFTS